MKTIDDHKRLLRKYGRPIGFRFSAGQSDTFCSSANDYPRNSYCVVDLASYQHPYEIVIRTYGRSWTKTYQLAVDKLLCTMHDQVVRIEKEREEDNR